MVLIGVLLVALVAVDAGVPGLVPGLRDLFRVPVAPASKRRARLLLAGGIGVVFIVCGTAGARLSVPLRTEWKLRESQRQITEKQATEQLESARKHLAANEVELAEFTLMNASGIAGIAPQQRAEIDELLERIRRSGDASAIMDLLLRLPPAEFEALARGESVPKGLEFNERALTYRAVGIARARIEQARAARAHPSTDTPANTVAPPPSRPSP